jgi:hypothetical protein
MFLLVNKWAPNSPAWVPIHLHEASVMSFQAMPSKPAYAPTPSVLPRGACLLVSQTQGLPIVASTLTQLQQTVRVVDTLCAAESSARFTVRVQQWLAKAVVGARVYVCGDESFIWQVHGLARQAGLLNEDIELFKCGETRKLFCVHCAALQDIDESTTVSCQNCGVHLFVREHFSQRLGAYMGVCLNPDYPLGETSL